MSPDGSSETPQSMSSGLGESTLAQSVSAPALRVNEAGLAFPRPKRNMLERWPWFWFILPAFLAFLFIFVYPTVRAFYLSLYDWPGYGPINKFVWFDNFVKVAHSAKFRQAAGNSAKLFLVIFVLENTISLGLAMMLNRRSRMTHVYRVIIFLPQIMSAVATESMSRSTPDLTCSSSTPPPQL